jgi:DNA-binding Lrp family transcriptional regulator
MPHLNTRERWIIRTLQDNPRMSLSELLRSARRKDVDKLKALGVIERKGDKVRVVADAR